MEIRNQETPAGAGHQPGETRQVIRSLIVNLPDGTAIDLVAAVEFLLFQQYQADADRDGLPFQNWLHQKGILIGRIRKMTEEEELELDGFEPAQNRPEHSGGRLDLSFLFE